MKNNTPVVVRDPVNGQIKSIHPQELSALPIAQYHEFAGNFVNTQNALYYDSVHIVAGTAVTSAMKQATFTKGKSQSTTVFNTSTSIAEKGEYMTNMITDGEFEGGTTFILEQICVDISLTSDIATTYGTRGEIVAPNYTASVVISAANNFKAYTENLELQYLRNEDVKLRAPLKFWPSPFGASGWNGSPNGGLIQNGYNGISVGNLSRPVILQSEDRFSFVVAPLVATFTPTMSATIKVVLLGKAIKTYTP